MLGWSSHEAQWRSNIEEQTKRKNEIASIYRAEAPPSTLALLRGLRVDFVVLGEAETGYISKICKEAPAPCNLEHTRDVFTSILKPVFRSGEITIYAVP
jgi:uncharacterized membrane protein